ELPSEIVLPVDAAIGNGRVELERAPVDGHRDIRALRERRREPPLADEAPGADDVGDDVDDEGGGGLGHGLSFHAPPGQAAGGSAASEIARMRASRLSTR